MENLYEKVQRSFHAVESSVMYGRSAEMQRISEFLNSAESILHITGNPGTGKTCTVKAALSGREYKYINYYNQPGINKMLKSCKSELVVIDEFDKYFQERRAECIKNVGVLSRSGAKLITISNNLRMGNLKFKPYSSDEIVCILREKIKNEIGENIIEENALKYIAKKFDQSGDLRQVFKYILEVIQEKGDFTILKVSDLIQKGDVKQVQSVHHEIICDILKEVVTRESAFSAYIKQCRNMKIQSFERNDFELIFEMYN